MAKLTGELIGKVFRTSASEPSQLLELSAVSHVVAISIMIVLPTLVFPIGHAEDDIYDPTSIQPWHFNAACNFLSSLYNAKLGLLSETLGNHTYWISSDNLLAERALELCPSTSALAQSINMTIRSCCGLGYDYLHEVILNKSVPTLIRDGNPPVVIANSTIGRLFNGVTPLQNGGNYTVLWEVHNQTGILHDTDYGDMAAYNATELEHEGRHDLAMRDIRILEGIDYQGGMDDRNGIVDKAYNASTGYQTYKTALYILALARTHTDIPWWIEDRLFNMQRSNGGFYTAYNASGFPIPGSQQNAETTAIAILTIASLPPVPVRLALSVDCDVLKQVAETRVAVANPTGGHEWLNVSAYWDGVRFDVQPIIAEPPGGTVALILSKSLVPDVLKNYNVTVIAGNTTKTSIISGSYLWFCQYGSLVLLISLPIAAVGVLVCLRKAARMRKTRSGSDKSVTLEESLRDASRIVDKPRLRNHEFPSSLTRF